MLQEQNVINHCLFLQKVTVVLCEMSHKAQPNAICTYLSQLKLPTH